MALSYLTFKRDSINKKRYNFHYRLRIIRRRRRKRPKCQKNKSRSLKKYIDFFRPNPAAHPSRTHASLPPPFYPVFLLPRSNTNFTDTGRIEEGKSSCKILHQGKRVPLFPFLRCNGHRSCYSWSGILLWDEKGGRDDEKSSTVFHGLLYRWFTR